MLISMIEDYIICIILGFGMGITASWAFIKQRIQRRNIGKVIETAFIEKNVLELEVLSTYLDTLISKMKECSDDLNSHIVNARDIELNLSSISELDMIDNIDVPPEINILEKNK